MSEQATEQPARAAISDIEEALKDVVDPELGINVVDLGLIYSIHVDDDNVATVDMTLTSAACPLTDLIEEQAYQVLCAGMDGPVPVTVSIGVAWAPEHGLTRDDLVKTADDALYRAKEGGRNQVVMAAPPIALADAS